jgi:hypothetical protein
MPKKRTTQMPKTKKPRASWPDKLDPPLATNPGAVTKAPKVVTLQPKPDEHRVVADYGMSRRYIMGIGRRRIACDVMARVIDLTPSLKPGTVVPFGKPNSCEPEPKKSA